jgi:uncharacterized hydrophobic protein (TIGR00271 family)
MAVLALITRTEQIGQVVTWAAHFAKALDSPLTVMCWAYTPVVGHQKETSIHSCDLLIEKVRDFIASGKQAGLPSLFCSPDSINLIARVHPREASAVVAYAIEADIELIVAAAEDPEGNSGATYASNPLLRNSPCHTVILFGGPKRSCQPNCLLVGATDTPHDSDALFLASQLAMSAGSRVILARTEFDDDQVVLEVGRRELRDLMREAGVDHNKQFQCHVFPASEQIEIAAALEDSNLVLVGANNHHVAKLIELTTRPTFAVIKRAPPLRPRHSLQHLRPWRQGAQNVEWSSQLSPSGYADLLQGLRRGSRLSTDFLTMLSLAAIVASIGLLQNSAAVVIGSMLLAPLMTPMVGCGLALAQANPKLGNMALLSVGIGLLCTLVISFIIGIMTPGIELTPQILARGDPTLLDFMVALASATAASFAMARPNLLGSIAGVAIATALMPPLCSVGLSLAYLNFSNAMGASLLFATNFVSIVLGSALTFRLMGVTSTALGSRQRQWVSRTSIALVLAAILFSLPLHNALQRSLIEPKPQPRTYPLAGSVIDALERHIDQQADVALIAAGQPSTTHANADVVLVIGAPNDLEPAYAKGLIDVVRREMRDDSLVVEIHCLRELWQQKTR